MLVYTQLESGELFKKLEVLEDARNKKGETLVDLICEYC